MKKIIISIISAMFSFFMPAMAQDKFNSEIGCGVKQISRICPTFIWDSWTFEKIAYNANDSYVMFVVYGPRWSESPKTMTEEQKNEAANWIANEFIEAYKGNIDEHTLCGDGDFMLYLAIGNLLHKMAGNDIPLYICLKPNKDSSENNNVLLKVSPQQISKLIK